MVEVVEPCIETPPFSHTTMVDVVESFIVVPSEETPKHRIWLSNLDLVAPKGYTPKVYLFRKNSTHQADYFSIKVLKDAFAKALVHFYPFAGRLANGLDRRLEIDCNGEGALFVVARSELSMDDFQEFKPSAEVKQMFFPNMDVADPPCVLLMVQVTILRCGSVVMGVTDHHMVGDGRNVNYFVETWSSIARGITNPPISRSFDRTLLRSRNPPSESIDRPEFSPYDHPNGAPPQAITCILNITKDQLHSLKSRCPTGTTYTTIACHLWRSMCLARRLSVDQETRLLFPVDVRNRVVPPLPSEYFGGAIVSLQASAKAAELVSMPLGFGAEKIRQAIEKVDDTYVRSFIDHIELEETRKKMGMRSIIQNTDMVVISWLGLGSYNVDFGWGSPEWMSFAQLPACGFVCLNDSPKKDGGVSVVLSLEHETVERFKKIFYEEMNIIPTVDGPRPFQVGAKPTLLAEIAGFNATKIEARNTDVLLNI